MRGHAGYVGQAPTAIGSHKLPGLHLLRKTVRLAKCLGEYTSYLHVEPRR